MTLRTLATACLLLLPALAVLLAPQISAIVLVPALLGLAAAALAVQRRWVGAEVGGLRTRVQDASLRLVNTNVQLLSLKELWRAMARPGQVGELLDTALSFCQRAAGFPEVMLLRLEPRSGELVGQWRPAQPGGGAVQAVRWGIGGVGGAVARVLRSCRSVAGDGEAALPLLTINGDPAEVARHAGSYVVVPLISPQALDECRPDAWLYREGCPSFEPASPTGPRAVRHGGGLDLSPCLTCQHFPVHGVLVVTDRGRTEPVRKSDQLTLESLAYAVGALLANHALYEDVKAAERFRDQVLDGMTNGLLTTDAHGRIMFVNRQAAVLRAEGAQELRGRRLEELFEAPDGGLPLRQTLVEGAPTLHLEALLHRAGGRAAGAASAAGSAAGAAGDVPVRVSLTPFTPHEGAPHGALCVFEDLTGVRAMQEEIRHLDTLAAIGRFASSLAHEVRNPLGGIGAGVGYLARSARLARDERDCITRIQAEVERLDRTIKDLLGVARPSPLQLTPTPAADAVARAAAQSLAPWAQQRGVRVLVTPASGLPVAHLDRDLIQQVLVNLIKNGVEASRAGDVVEVGVAARSMTPPASRRRSDRPADSVEGIAFTVKDRGCGIEPADIPRLFEPFYSKKSGGTGLGLFVCFSAVERHGGRIQVQSRPGEGACFTVELPCFPAVMGASHEPEHSHR